MRKYLVIPVMLLLMVAFVTPLIAGGHDNHMGVFVGAASNNEAEHTDFAAGVDYERRLHKWFGVGVIGEIIFAEHKEYLAMGEVFYHPIESLKFLAAYGVAAANYEIEVDGQTESETETHGVLRLGAAYDIHVTQFTISPTVNYDLIEGHGTWVYGITFGIGF